jgi:putative MATE family efflux protein
MKKINLTEGSIPKSLVKLSIPIIFANLLQTTYNLTDTFWVGHLGHVAVAAVSLTFPIIFFIVSLANGLTMAGTILVAQYKGEENGVAIKHVTTQTFFVVLLISAILALVGYILSPEIIRLMNPEPAVFSEAVIYLKISFIGLIFLFVYMVFQSLMRGVGEVKIPMYIVLGTVLLNFVLDPLFIRGYGVVPPMGVKGAAISTVVTQGLAAIIGVFLLIKGESLVKLDFGDLKPDWQLLKKMVFLGLPVSIEQSARALGITLMTYLVTRFGTVTLAAYGIGSRILSFIIIPTLGLSVATSTMVGQNIGAEKFDRIKHIVNTSARIGFFTLTFLGVLFFVFSLQLVEIFIPGDIIGIQKSSLFLEIMSLSFGFIGLQMAYSGLFRGTGKTKISMLMSIISLWILRLPAAYLFAFICGLGELGIWIAFPFSNVISGIIAAIIAKKGSWDKKVI